MENNEKERKEMIKNLTLALMYLTSWEDSVFKPNELAKLRAEERAEVVYQSCWKGYDFDILNELTDGGLVNVKGHRKSAVILPEGIERAKALLNRLDKASFNE